MPRLPALSLTLLMLSGCMPMMGTAPGGGPGGAYTPGPTAANLPPPGTPMTPATCAQYRATAQRAGMMTPQLDAQFKAQGC